MIEKNLKDCDTAVLVTVADKMQSDILIKEHLDELEFLADTLGVKIKAKFSQKLDKPDVKTFVGKGKAEEILAFIQEEEIESVIFDDDLSPSQLRNLENLFKCRIYDRSLLILDIFLKRAQTSQAKTQVELARYQYLLPRLTRMWTHLERQRGGTGTRGGAGEKEIETDRRMIRNQISILKGRLEKIDKQNETQRKARSGVIRVALVGYTNVGKSTLMNLLSKSKVLEEDRLFATVDATVRKVVIDNTPFLLSDTVGFIRKLPHHLIESFKSTLNEVVEADLLLHVVDASHSACEDHISVVNNTLAELGAGDKDMVYVFNKIDAWEDSSVHDNLMGSADGIEMFKSSLVNKHENNSVYISAKKKINIEELKTKILEKVKEKHEKIYPNYLKKEFY